MLAAGSEPCPAGQPGQCFRVRYAGPLSGVFPGDQWPEAIASPPAPGHRRLRAILADVHKRDADLAALRAEYDAAAAALFTIQEQSAAARAGGA
jgi:hypothetical protein